VIGSAQSKKRELRPKSLLSRPWACVQGGSAGLKLAKNHKTAEKELCLQLFAARQML
jgi:hypothetical protein